MHQDSGCRRSGFSVHSECVHEASTKFLASPTMQTSISFPAKRATSCRTLCPHLSSPAIREGMRLHSFLQVVFGAFALWAVSYQLLGCDKKARKSPAAFRRERAFRHAELAAQRYAALPPARGLAGRPWLLSRGLCLRTNSIGMRSRGP